MAFGLGRNSTILNSLYTAGHIASRSWAMFWGRTGGTADTQQDGNFVFGGFDKSKASGNNYTSDLNYSNKNCGSGMLVTITDLELNFPNGTTASLFDGMQSSAILACIVPDYPVLMTLPRDPYFERFESLTNESFTDRGFGVYYYGMLYPNSASMYAYLPLPFKRDAYNSIRYTGDLTVTLNNGFSVRIPNDQLVVPNLTIDPSTGSLHANGSSPELVINSIQQVNQGDLPQLGRQFLSSAYLMSNQDSNTFTLWNAALEEEENLVAIDTNNKPVDSYCAATPTSTSSSTPSAHSTSSHDKKLSTGAIVGIAIGSAAALAIVAAGVFLVVSKKKKKGVVHVNYYPTAAYRDPPSELGPSHMEPHVPNELPAKPPSPTHRFANIQELA